MLSRLGSAALTAWRTTTINQLRTSGAHRRVPTGFASTVARCLAPDPAARLTVAQLSAELDALL